MLGFPSSNLLLFLLFSPSKNLYADFFPRPYGTGIFVCFCIGYVRKITFREDIQKMDELDNDKPP